MPIQLIRQDITKIECDAIVNPSNEKLYPTGGTDLMIHKAAGEKLLEACRKIGGCPTGEAVITPAFNLPCRYVIHTAGPVWQGGGHNEGKNLVSCYQKSLNLAIENGCRSIAFPLISSGLYGFPKMDVLRIALYALSAVEYYSDDDITVYIVLYDKESYKLGEELYPGIDAYIDDNYVAAHSVNYRRNTHMLERRRREAVMCESSAMPAPCMQSSLAEKKKSLDEYIKLDESFAEKLLKLIDAKGMDDVACYKRANVSKQTWHKLMTDKNYKPNKKTAISFAISLMLTLEETQNLLASVGFVLSDSSLFDVIIKYCIENEKYNILEIDSVLFKYDQETLFSVL